MRLHFRIAWLWLVLILVLLGKAAHCQELPDAPRPSGSLSSEGLVSVIQPTSRTTLDSNVAQSWARRNRWWIAGFLVLQAGDAAATERNWRRSARAFERNPLIPESRAGRVAYFAGTAGAVLGASWLADRLGHRRLSKWILTGGCMVEAQANVASWGEL